MPATSIRQKPSVCTRRTGVIALRCATLANVIAMTKSCFSKGAACMYGARNATGPSYSSTLIQTKLYAPCCNRHTEALWLCSSFSSSQYARIAYIFRVDQRRLEPIELGVLAAGSKVREHALQQKCPARRIPPFVADHRAADRFCQIDS